MVHSKRILAEVTSFEVFEGGQSAITHEDWTFIVPQFDIDTDEEQAIDAAFSMACALTRETATYDMLPEGAKPEDILYVVEWEDKLMPVRFAYSQEQRRYAMLIGDINIRNSRGKRIKTIKTINSR